MPTAAGSRSTTPTDAILVQGELKRFHPPEEALELVHEYLMREATLPLLERALTWLRSSPQLIGCDETVLADYEEQWLCLEVEIAGRGK